MNTLTIVALAVAASGTAKATDSTLGDLVVRIQAADYRGDRAQLNQLADRVRDLRDPGLAAYGQYWRGFALWRRAINGFNEAPTPTDLRRDLDVAVESFHAALVEKARRDRASGGPHGLPRIPPLSFQG
jgi:hypothetical protein